MAYNDDWAPARLLKKALEDRDELLYVQEHRSHATLSQWMAHEASADDVLWVIPLEAKHNDMYMDPHPLLHALVNVTDIAIRQRDPIIGARTAAKRAIFLRAIVLPNVNLEICMRVRNALVTPLEYALRGDVHWAATQLLKAGASTASVSHHHGRFLERGWFNCKRACVLNIVVFMGTNRRKRIMPRDVARLIALLVWDTRYDLLWEEASGTRCLERYE